MSQEVVCTEPSPIFVIHLPACDPPNRLSKHELLELLSTCELMAANRIKRLGWTQDAAAKHNASGLVIAAGVTAYSP